MSCLHAHLRQPRRALSQNKRRALTAVHSPQNKRRRADHTFRQLTTTPPQQPLHTDVHGEIDSTGITMNNSTTNNTMMLHNTQYSSQIMAPLQVPHVERQPLYIQHQ